MFQKKRLDHERYSCQRQFTSLQRQTTTLSLEHNKSCRHRGCSEEFCHLLYDNLCCYVLLLSLPPLLVLIIALALIISLNVSDKKT